LYASTNVDDGIEFYASTIVNMDQQILLAPCKCSNPIWPPRKPRGKTKAMILLANGIRVLEFP
jgi:hypothetical protein